MRVRAAVLSALVAVVPAAVVVSGGGVAQARSVQCSYSPVLPKTIVVNHPTINFRTPVHIGGADCTRVFTASESLSHGSDKYFLNWTQDSLVASDAVYATTVVPGTYTAPAGSDCGVRDKNGVAETCTVGAGSTVIKFGSSTGLTVTRLTGHNAGKVQLWVKVARYSPVSAAYLSTAVAIQRYSAGAWHTVARGTTNGAHGYVWTYSDAAAEHYRAVSAETSVAFASVSAVVVR